MKTTKLPSQRTHIMKPTKITKTALTLASAGILLAAALPAAADALVYEGFNYTVIPGGDWEPHSAANGPSGFGWLDTAWVQGTKWGIDQTATSAQSFGSLLVEGSGATSGGGGGGGGLWGNRGRLLDSSISDAGLLDDGATLWFSFLAKNEGGYSTEKIGFALANGDFTADNQHDLEAGISGVGVYSKDTGPAYAAYWTGGPITWENNNPASDIPTNSSDSTLIVGKIEWGAASANETLTLYAPDLALNQGAASNQVVSIPDLNQQSFDRISLLIKEDAFIDEIRLGATYADVVPSAADIKITSITDAGSNNWDLTLEGSPSTAYVLYSSATLDFTPGTSLTGLTATVGTISGGSTEIVTTDVSGNATVQVTLTGNPKDFVRAQSN